MAEPGKGITIVETEAVAGAPETQEQFIARRDREISTWLDRKGALDAVKPQELEARNTVAATLFPTPKKGTNRYHLNGGYAIKLVHGTNYTLGDKDKVEGEGEDAVKVPVADQVYSQLSKIAAFLMESGRNQAEADAFLNTLVEWKPELKEKAYLALDTTNNVEATVKAMLDEIITTKPATPQLTFEVPKEK